MKGGETLSRAYEISTQLRKTGLSSASTELRNACPRISVLGFEIALDIN
jgi:hypothetical protein